MTLFIYKRTTSIHQRRIVMINVPMYVDNTVVKLANRPLDVEVNEIYHF